MLEELRVVKFLGSYSFQLYTKNSTQVINQPKTSISNFQKIDMF